MSHTQKQEWNYSGVSCFSPVKTCLLSWCCPCIIYGRTHHRMNIDHKLEGYSICNLSCAAFCGLACMGVSFVLPIISRGHIREKYHLQGNVCKDCLCACCCQPCDLAQQDKEALWQEEQRNPPQQRAPVQYQSSSMQYQSSSMQHQRQ